MTGLSDNERARRVTAEQFEREYAARSRIAVEKLREYGRIVVPCDCGDDMCEGWQSVNGADWAADREMRGLA